MADRILAMDFYVINIEVVTEFPCFAVHTMLGEMCFLDMHLNYYKAIYRKKI